MVVLSYRNERTIAAALESLLDQGEPLEIVVSHSGGGDTPALLCERFPDIHVDAVEERRRPGAARNAGVAASRAPYVSFHAGDSIALPGWAAGRLELHRNGARVVGSAIAPPRGLAPLAAHVLLHSTRMPHVTPEPHLRFGASYAREVLERYGPFPERMDGEEDVELNERLIRAGVPVEGRPGSDRARVRRELGRADQQPVPARRPALPLPGASQAAGDPGCARVARRAVGADARRAAGVAGAARRARAQRAAGHRRLGRGGRGHPQRPAGMRITFLGHAGLYIETEAGSVLCARGSTRPTPAPGSPSRATRA